MGSRAIHITHGAVVAWAALVLSCASIDEGLLPSPGDGSGNGGSGGGPPDRDGGGGMDGAIPGGDGSVAADGAVTADGCVASTELCNGVDDDCDTTVDEGGDEACTLVVPNAVTVCQRSGDTAFCLNLDCLEGYDNCDGLNENGCEPYCDCNVCDDAGAEDGG